MEPYKFRQKLSSSCVTYGVMSKGYNFLLNKRYQPLILIIFLGFTVLMIPMKSKLKVSDFSFLT